jgi:diguanylate cyclase (GGDEF)-like protein
VRYRECMLDRGTKRGHVRKASLTQDDLGGRRLTARRAVALSAALLAVSAIVYELGPTYVWPLFIFPLFLAAIFFFELGSLIVTAWLVAFFIVDYAVHVHPTVAATREAVIGTALFTVAGLLLGRVRRNDHRMQALLAASTLTDRLTGLYNYGTFVDYLHNEVRKVDRYGGELTLVMFDIDHFKEFNDRHGHEVGNDMLRRVGATLRTMVREADMAARYGGEEFAVLIRGDDTHGFELAERVRRAIETQGVELKNGALVFATVSGGIATYPAGAPDETALIEHADKALYASKHRGRNRVTIDKAAEEEGDLASILTA